MIGRLTTVNIDTGAIRAAGQAWRGGELAGTGVSMRARFCMSEQEEGVCCVSGCSDELEGRLGAGDGAGGERGGDTGGICKSSSWGRVGGDGGVGGAAVGGGGRVGGFEGRTNRDTTCVSGAPGVSRLSLLDSTAFLSFFFLLGSISPASPPSPESLGTGGRRTEGHGTGRAGERESGRAGKHTCTRGGR